MEGNALIRRIFHVPCLWFACRTRNLLIGTILLALVLAAASSGAPRPAHPPADIAKPELPRVFLDDSYSLNPGRRVVTFCASGCDARADLASIQAQLDALPCKGGGELAISPADPVTVRPNQHLILRNKGVDCDWIVIRAQAPSQAGAALPQAGNRVSPASAAAMATLIKSGSDAAIVTEAGANHYRLVGLQVELAPGVSQNYALVDLGDGTAHQSELADVPSNLVVDRCFIHGNASAQLLRAISLQSASTIIEDSYISEAHWQGADSQAIIGWNGPGPYRIVNNFLEGAGENIMFGGADPAVNGLVPSDIEIRGNLIRKDTDWQHAHWSVKNLLELKNAQRVLVDGNILEYNWVNAQTGFAVLLTPRNQSGRCPWCVVQDVTFTNNVVRHASGFFNALGHDDIKPQQGVTQRVLIANNLFYDCAAERWGKNGRGIQVLGGGVQGVTRGPGPQLVTIDHNTVLSCTLAVFAEGIAFPNFRITNNIFAGTEGLAGNGKGEGDSTAETYFPGLVLGRNIFVGRPERLYQNLGKQAFPATVKDLGLAPLSPGEPEYFRFRLSPRSHFARWGTDGTAVGVDYDRLQTALQSRHSQQASRKP